MTAYFVELDGKQQGPLSLEEVRGLVKTGVIKPHTRMWTAGLSDWAKADTVLGQTGLFAAVTPPPLSPKPSANLPFDIGGLPREAFGGFGSRFAAYFVDSLILWIPTTILAAIAGALEEDHEDASALAWVVTAMFPQLYHALFVSSRMQATPGKAALGLVVVNSVGGRLGFWHALGRNMAALLSYVILYLGFFMAIWTERRQALHDKIAGTFVINKRVVQALETGKPVAESGATLLVTTVVVGFAVVAVVGILAAIAIPAYQDYIARSQAAEALSLLHECRTPVAEFYSTNKRWPTDLSETCITQGKYTADIVAVHDSTTNPFEAATPVVKLEAVLKEVGVSKLVAGKSVTLETADGGASWSCTGTGTIDAKYLPGACR